MISDQNTKDRSQRKKKGSFIFGPLTFSLLPFTFIILFLPCALSLVPLASEAYASATLTLAWDKNQESDVIGYKVHYGATSGTYQYHVDVKNNTSCSISGLAEGTTYYFAATAYDNQNIESSYSEELAHTIPNNTPPPPPPPVDTDGDGILDNDEISIYGTDPGNPDTDGDGINDGDELSHWGKDWNSDSDGDGLINLLDFDSDNDNYSDGQELNTGFDPSDQNSRPASVKIWLEAESGYLNSPMVIATDADASEGEYILIPKGNKNNLDPKANAGYAEYTFPVPASGEYVIWGRVNAANGGSDSFFVSVDGNDYARWATQISPTWIWDQMADSAVNDPLVVHLETGEHTLVVKHREPQTKIDKILITNDTDYVPMGLGEENIPQTPLIVDTDADGILDDDEVNTYGTNPGKSDTDGDGINDGEELKFWGNNWNVDSDGDGLVNLLDLDSDNDGFTDGQELSAGFDPMDPELNPGSVKIWIEAESGYLNPPMEIAADAGSSSGEYISIPRNYGNNLDPNANAGYAEYTFLAPASGEYVVWGRVNAADGGSDSFFVSVDGNDYARWATQISSAWIWDQVADSGVNDPVVFHLEPGEHTLIIKHREPSTKIDKILITNDMEYIPK